MGFRTESFLLNEKYQEERRSSLVALLNAADLNKKFIEIYTDKLIDEGFECDKDVMHLMDTDIKNEVMKDIGMKRGEMIKLERCIKHRMSESLLSESVSAKK